MEQVRSYVISVAAAAMVVGILTGLSNRKDTAGVLLRMIGGLFLAFTVLRPIVDLDVGNLSAYFDTFTVNGDAAAAAGENLSREALCSYIKAQTEAYILDKAEDYGASLTVEVYLDEGETPVPVGARLQGNVSPYGKACLREMMEEDLGIMEVDQLWIG